MLVPPRLRIWAQVWGGLRDLASRREAHGGAEAAWQEEARNGPGPELLGTQAGRGLLSPGPPPWEGPGRHHVWSWVEPRKQPGETQVVRGTALPSGPTSAAHTTVVTSGICCSQGPGPSHPEAARDLPPTLPCSGVRCQQSKVCKAQPGAPQQWGLTSSCCSCIWATRSRHRWSPCFSSATTASHFSFRTFLSSISCDGGGAG